MAALASLCLSGQVLGFGQAGASLSPRWRAVPSIPPLRGASGVAASQTHETRSRLAVLDRDGHTLFLCVAHAPPPHSVHLVQP